MTEILSVLASVQEHDTAIDRLRRRLGSLPERAVAHELNERRHAVEARLVALATQLDKLTEAEEGVERELAVVETRSASLESALRSPGSASRDAQAIIHEIDQLREQAGLLEERGLGLLEERDGLVGDQTQAQAELDQVAADAPAILAAVVAAEGEAGDELNKLEAERASLVADIDAALMTRYEKLRLTSNGVAVATVLNGACTGCHLSLAAVDVEHLSRLKPGEFASCEQCGRILIPA